MQNTDEAYMRRALALAERALLAEEVPVGALVVVNGSIVGEGYNLRETSRIATHHAEVLAIEEACRTMGGWRLPGSTLYVTLEPCPMCAGALLAARVERVVFGASDAKGGGMGGCVDLSALPGQQHPAVTGGVLEAECRSLLERFFAYKREHPIPRSNGAWGRIL